MMNHTKQRLFLCLLSFAIGSAAMAEPPGGIEVNIPAQSVGDALNQFAEQSGLQVVLYADDADGVETKALVGQFGDPAVALAALLASTGLEHEFLNANTVTVKAVAEEEVASDLGNSRTRPILMAQNQTPAPQTKTDETKGDDDEEDVLQLENITVTGTHIRGIAPDSSPVRIFTREDIEISGAATAQDFIQTLTTNFGGGSNADFSLGSPNDRNSVFNTGGEGALGSSVNLRGLGSGATLVLLNGHRLAPSSGIGDFVDISMIPASAIERVEVMTDGASAIYGADAVAGVVNFVLRSDFVGVEASFRYGTVTEGDLDEYRASITAGKSWDSGNALAVYEYYDQNNLSAEDRDFAEEAPLPFDLLPSQERHSLLVAATQDLSPNVELYADITFSTRDSVRNRTNRSGTMFRFAPTSRSVSASAGGTWRASDTWYVDLSGTYSDLHSEPNSSGDFDIMRELDSDIWTVDAKASGDLFALPGGDVKLAVGGHFRSEAFANFNALDNELERQADREVYAVFGEAFIPIIGPENSIPGVERLEINVSGRFEDYSDFGSTADPKVGVLWSPVESLRLRGSYSTSFQAPPLGLVGANDLQASVFSTSFLNSVLGFTPGDPSIADVVVISVSGTANNLDPETSRAFTAGVDFSKEWGKSEFTFTATWFDIELEDRLGQTPCFMCTSNSPFDAPNIAFNSPGSFPSGTVIFSPTLDQINGVLNGLDSPFVAPFGDDPLDAEIINFVPVVRNLAFTAVSGIDFNFDYTYELEIGTFILGLDGSYLEDFDRQAAASTPVIDQVDTLFNPLDLRLRGRAGFTRDRFAVNVFVNYTDRYHVDNIPGSATIDSWTTVDLSLSYDTRENPGNSFLDNTVLRLSVLNAFDEDPPSTIDTPSFAIFGFDPTNASPLNRFIAIEVTKRF